MKKELPFEKRNFFSLIVILMFLSAGAVLFSGCGSGGRGGPTSLAPSPSTTTSLVSPTLTATISLSAPTTGTGSFSPNGQYFYASVSNGVDVIDTTTDSLVTTIPVSGSPVGPITFSGPPEMYVETTSSTGNLIYTIDPLNNTIISSSPTTAVSSVYPSNKHTGYGYTILGWNDAVSILDLPSLTVAATINSVTPRQYPTDPGEWTAINPIYHYGYVAVRGAGADLVVDLDPTSPTFGTVVKTIPTAVSGVQTYGPCDITISSNGKYIYNTIMGFPKFGETQLSPGYTIVIDVNPTSSTYGQVIQQVPTPSGYVSGPNTGLMMTTVSPDDQYLAIEGSGGEMYYTINPSTGLITNPTSPYWFTSTFWTSARTDEFTPSSNRDFVMDGSDVYVVTMVPSS